jgi:inositol 1,4,5-triphosphate receptor type 1
MRFYVGKALLAGGGVGDLSVWTLDSRIWNDILFFIVITTILLNIIFGIIIDTFSALRAEKDWRAHVTENYCFICGIEKVTFDRAEGNSEGFANHIKQDHFMWNYMKFIFHVWEQDRDDDDGM